MVGNLRLGCVLRTLSSIGAFVATPIAVSAGMPGKDGPVVVSGTDVVLNEYGLVAGALLPGATSVTVGALGAALPSLEAGDLIMFYQAQGATISGTDSAAYGAVTSLNGAGRYEFQTVASISGDTINLATYGGACGGLSYGYDTGEVQVIRVPQATTLSVPSGSSLRPPAWNGSTGGVVALHVRDTLTLDGDIDASARGFRGGAADNLSSPVSRINPAGYVSSASNLGAEKGESIAGFQDDYPGGRYQRGAPANGGGGGNGHNAGGGGGANGSNGLPWNGQGNPDRSVPAWDQAWNIDGTLTATTTSSGGGRGGYTFARNGDALTTPPGDSAWGNDFRREVGGLGGRPLAFDASGRLYFGGGGGAGDGNNSAAGRGGNGAGLVFIIADTVLGSGRILADGEAGRDTSPRHNDAPGGGGAGGTVVLSANSLSGVAVRARGGRGGNQLITTAENEGPGGGGGGVVAVAGGLPGSVQVTGGANGTTSASSMSEFVPNGATRGGSGQPNEAAATGAALPICRIPPGKLEASKTVAPWNPDGTTPYALPGNEVVYTFTIGNVGYQPVTNGSLELTDALPAEVEFYNGEFDPSSAPVSGPVEFADTSGTTGLSCCAGGVEVAYASSPGALAPPYTYTPSAGHDPDVSHIRVTPSGEMAPQTEFTLKFRARIK